MEGRSSQVQANHGTSFNGQNGPVALEILITLGGVRPRRGDVAEPGRVAIHPNSESSAIEEDSYIVALVEAQGLARIVRKERLSVNEVNARLVLLQDVDFKGDIFGVRGNDREAKVRALQKR